ncbi:MAG: SurA N-terminal domain-containing protein [Holosporaceae bacterium]|jgi:peptidyl-prolyl cis-trans isomerase D|nr:SurA N-terminal domain-containing protein [Holosporaceae bacterium]
MLEFIRRHSKSVVVKIFLTVLALTFVLCFGIFDVVRKLAGKDYVVKIGSLRITQAMFMMEKAKKLNILRRRERNLDDKIATMIVLRQMIWESVIDLAAADFGFRVSDAAMKEFIRGCGLFVDKEGRFSAKLLRGLLQQAQIPEAMFLEMSKKDLKNTLLRAPFQYVAVDIWSDIYARAHSEKRTLTVVVLDPASCKIDKKPSPEELEEFYRKNQAEFMVEESRSFHILELRESSLEKDIAVGEDELKEAYDGAPEKDEHSFEEMKTELMSNLKQEKLQSKVNDFTRQVEDALMAGEKAENVAKKFNLKLMKAAKVNSKNQDAKSKKILDVPYADDAVSLAFTMDEGGDSSFAEAVDEKKNRVLWLIHLDEIVPKHAEEFSGVMDRVREAWLKEERHKKAINLANELVSRVKQPGDLEKLAMNGKRNFGITPPFDRHGKSADEKNTKYADVIAAVHEEAFDKGKNEAAYRDMVSKVVVHQLKEVQRAKKIDPQDGKKLSETLTQEMHDDLYQQLVGCFSGKYEISINQEVLKNSNSGVNFDEFF